MLPSEEAALKALARCFFVGAVVASPALRGGNEALGMIFSCCRGSLVKLRKLSVTSYQLQSMLWIVTQFSGGHRIYIGSTLWALLESLSYRIHVDRISYEPRRLCWLRECNLSLEGYGTSVSLPLYNYRNHHILGSDYTVLYGTYREPAKNGGIGS